MRPDDFRDPDLRERWLARLPLDERSRYRRLRSEETRATYLAARALTRTTLSRYAGIDFSAWRFGAGFHGKPAVVEPRGFDSLRFNVTHTNGLVICIATLAGEVGIDAEDTSQPVDAALVARHFLSAGHEAQIIGLPPSAQAQRFFEHWVLKEAYVKATGNGLAETPERFSVDRDDDQQTFVAGGCRFWLYRPTPNHVAAAAILPRVPSASVAFESFTGSACPMDI